MKYVFIVLAVFSVIPGRAQQLGLKECIETAIRNNPDIKQAEWQARSGQIGLRQSKAAMAPELNAGINHGLNQGRSIDPFTNSYVNQEVAFAGYSINSSLVLWNGGNLRNSKGRDASSYEAATLELQQVKDNVMLNVVLAYLQVLNNEEQLNLARQQAQVTRQQVERLEVLDRQGAIAPALLYDLKGQLGADELNEINAKNAVETAKLALARIMNVDYSPAMQLQKFPELAIVLPDTNTVTTESAIQLPGVKAAAQRLLSARKEFDAARGSRWPSIVVSAGLGTNYSSAARTLQLLGVTDVVTSDYVMVSGTKTPVYSPQSNYSSQKISYGDQWKNNFNSGISLGLRIPIFNGAAARTRISSARNLETLAAFQAKTAETSARQDLKQAQLNQAVALERYLKLEQQVKDYEASFKAAAVRFESGVGTPVDYLIAKNNLDRARGNLVAARYDYLLRSKVLDYYSGKAVY